MSTSFLTSNDIRNEDVLFGRGQAAHVHPGNVRLRELVAERAMDYKENADSVHRRTLALEIIGVVHASNGRFVKRLETVARNPSRKITGGLGVSNIDAQWQVVDLELAVTKVKQALRDAAALLPSIPTAAPNEQKSLLDTSSRRSAPGEIGPSTLANQNHPSPINPMPHISTNLPAASPVAPFTLSQPPTTLPQLQQPHPIANSIASLLQQRYLQTLLAQQAQAAEARNRQQTTADALRIFLVAAHANSGNQSPQQQSWFGQQPSQQQQQQPVTTAAAAEDSNSGLQQIRQQLLLLAQMGLLPQLQQLAQQYQEQHQQTQQQQQQRPTHSSNSVFSPISEPSPSTMDSGQEEDSGDSDGSTSKGTDASTTS